MSHSNADQDLKRIQFAEIDNDTLIKKIAGFNGKKIMVIGDIGVDDYVMGEVRRISPEAPVPVLEVQSEETRLGLAANVAQNIQSLGGEPYILSVVGKDDGADLLKRMFMERKLNWSHIISDPSRPTTRKTRIMASHHHLVRVDREVRKYLDKEFEDRVFVELEALMPKMDGVILEDYAKGIVSMSLIQRVVQLCQRHNKPLYVDPHRNNVGSFYNGVDLIKPNYEEALALTKLDADEISSGPNLLYQAGRELQKITGAKKIVITRGREGMTIFSEGTITEVPTYARKVFDVTGAGDTVIATMALALVSGNDLVTSCVLANFAAGVVVGKVGCVPCSQEELKEYILERD